MDDIQSWSAFDKQQVQNNNNNNNNVSSSFTTVVEHTKGVDSLYVSATSENVAPAAVALLRQAGLTSVDSRRSSSSSSLGYQANNNNIGDITESEEEEFRLRFHWMRPHPSLVFSLEEEMDNVKREQKECQPLQNNDTQKKLSQTRPQQQQQHPAVITATMMYAYRDAQINLHETQMKDEENEAIMLEEESNHSQSNNMQVAECSSSSSINNITKSAALPFELPQLRVDLASLVEPPLMTSWLPSAENNIDTSYRDTSRKY